MSSFVLTTLAHPKVQRIFTVYPDRVEWVCEYLINGKWVVNMKHTYTDVDFNRMGFTGFNDYLDFKKKRFDVKEV